MCNVIYWLSDSGVDDAEDVATCMSVDEDMKLDDVLLEVEVVGFGGSTG